MKKAKFLCTGTSNIKLILTPLTFNYKESRRVCLGGSVFTRVRSTVSGSRHGDPKPTHYVLVRVVCVHGDLPSF